MSIHLLQMCGISICYMKDNQKMPQEVHRSEHFNKVEKNISIKNDVVLWALIAIVVLIGAYLFSFTSVFAPSTDTPKTPVSSVAISSEVSAVPLVKKNTSFTPVRTVPGTEKLEKVSVGAQYVGFGTMSSLFAFSKPLVCDVYTKDIYNKRSGAVYVSENKLRGNLTSYVNGVLTNTVMIDNGRYIYAWTKDALTGVTIPAPLLSAGGKIVSAGGIALTEQIDYSCNPWKTDASYFVLPKTVTFLNSWE